MSKRTRKHNVSGKAEVDIVITTGGRWDYLKECLNALKEQTVPVNVILIDHASEAEERIANQELFDGLTTKRLQQSIGFPAANNEGARMGTASLILFLNDDCALAPDAVERMIETMKEENIGVCGAKLLFPPMATTRPGGKVQHVGIGLNIRGDAIHPLLGWSPENPKTCNSRDVFAVTGACMMVRRSIFNKVGGFDKAYGLGTYEDVDLCVKARSLGFRVFVNAKAVGYHYAGATVEKKRVGYPLQLNASIFKTRWANTPFLIWDEYTYY